MHIHVLVHCTVQYFCNTKVAGLGEIFFQQNVSAILWYIILTACICNIKFCTTLLEYIKEHFSVHVQVHSSIGYKVAVTHTSRSHPVISVYIICTHLSTETC